MLGAIVLTAPKQQVTTEQPARVPPAAPATNAVPYTEAEMHRFWDENLKQLIEVQWLNKKLPFQEINDRFRVLTDSIKSITGTNPAIIASPYYHTHSTSVLGQAGRETNRLTGTVQVSITLYIPTIMDYHKHALNKFGISAGHFPITVLVTAMHELEHAAHPHENVAMTDLSEESRAWQETCRHTIDPLVVNHGVPMFGTEASFYKAWVNDGRRTGQAWTNNLYRLYGPLAIMKR